jgi:hypothetical protein
MILRSKVYPYFPVMSDKYLLNVNAAAVAKAKAAVAKFKNDPAVKKVCPCVRRGSVTRSRSNRG